MVIETEEIRKAIIIVNNITNDDLINCYEGGEKEYDSIQILLKYIIDLKAEINRMNTFKVNINNARSPKELLNEYVNNSILKQELIDKIKELEKYKEECKEKAKIFIDQNDFEILSSYSRVLNETERIINTLKKLLEK